MAFVIDSSEWDFNACNRDSVIGVVENFLDALDRMTKRGETFWLGRDFHTREMFMGHPLWSLFHRDSGLDLPRELSQELAGYLNKAPYYEDEPDWPDEFALGSDVDIDSLGLVQNYDVLWAHSLVKNNRACGCVGLFREGEYITTANGHAESIHWVISERNQVEFWRAAIIVQGDSPATLRSLAPHAYPNTFFPDSIWRGCTRFNGGYHSQSRELRRYLEVFDDHGHWVFTASPPAELLSDPVDEINQDAPSRQLIERRFLLFNLVVAPENPDVYADFDCREARMLDLDGARLYCEWHGKLQTWQNRVHIHPPVSQSENKIIVAFMADHLPLPND